MEIAALITLLWLLGIALTLLIFSINPQEDDL